MNYNRIIYGGRLTRDPELQFLPSNTPVVRFGMATNRKWKTETGEDREESCFVDCVAFGKMAEVINKHCTKGGTILVEGRLRFEQWEDKQSGGKRSKHLIAVEAFQFAGGPREGESTGRSVSTAGKTTSTGPDKEFKDEDVPF